MDDKLNLLIVSDIHAITSNESNKESHLLFENGQSDFGNRFIEFTKSLDRKIDALVCPGDISTAGSKDSFSLGWTFLNTIKSELSIPEILCTPGNHDHQSRPSDNNYNPKEWMQYITPTFPLEHFHLNTFFWSWNWCHYESSSEKYNVILVNTSASHGFSEEHKHGRIPKVAIKRIKEYIQSDKFKNKPINILLCHHHPAKMDHVDDDDDYQEMLGGGLLIKEISDCRKGPWMIIHGHKHFADITYASAPSLPPPIIFSAGSLAAKLYEKIEDRTSNQFYIVEIDLNKSLTTGKAVGTFEAYEALPGGRWDKSRSTNLPHSGGFGSEKNPGQIADEISRLIDKDVPFVERDELKQYDQYLDHFTPSETNRLCGLLEDKGLSVIREKNNIIQVGINNV